MANRRSVCIGFVWSALTTASVRADVPCTMEQCAVTWEAFSLQPEGPINQHTMIKALCGCPLGTVVYTLTLNATAHGPWSFSQGVGPACYDPNAGIGTANEINDGAPWPVTFTTAPSDVSNQPPTCLFINCQYETCTIPSGSFIPQSMPGLSPSPQPPSGGHGNGGGGDATFDFASCGRADSPCVLYMSCGGAALVLVVAVVGAVLYRRHRAAERDAQRRRNRGASRAGGLEGAWPSHELAASAAPPHISVPVHASSTHSGVVHTLNPVAAVGFGEVRK